MKWSQITVAPLGVNCVILEDSAKNAWIFDAGGSAQKIISFLADKGLTPVLLLNTHGHFDHIGAVQDLADRYSIPFAMHGDDEALLSLGSRSAEMYGFPPVRTPKLTTRLKDGDLIPYGKSGISVLHTPGHTPGGVCFYVNELHLLITGDTLFCESVGRTDLPGGSLRDLQASIRGKLLTLPDDTLVIPGHDVSTTIGHEKQYNPYVKM